MPHYTLTKQTLLYRLFCLFLCAVSLCAASAYIFYDEVFPERNLERRVVTLPDFSGMSREEAEETLALLDPSGSLFSLRYRTDGEREEETVSAQYPPAGASRTLLVGRDSCEIVLTVGQKPEPLFVPNAVGEDYRLAKAYLQAKGVFVTLFFEPDSAPYGTVLSLSPAEGVEIRRGDAVEIRVSLGELVTSLTVPPLVGLSRENAEETLRRCGFLPSQILFCGESEGDVVAQNLSPRTLVASTCPILLTLGHSTFSAEGHHL